MTKALWIDVETTGIDPIRDHIIELAAVHEDKIFHEYCLPQYKPSGFDEITELTGITWEFLEKNGISMQEMYDKFIVFLNSTIDQYDRSDKFIFCGYKTGFDNDFVRQLFVKNRNDYFGAYFYNVNIDVMSEVATALYYNRLSVLPDNFKLETVCNCFGIKFKAHSAIEDIQATIELFKLLQGEKPWIKKEETQIKDIETKLVT